MASAHIKQSKTLANLSYSKQLYTPQYTRDEAIGDMDRNKHCNDAESHLFAKQKTKQVKPCSRDTEKPCGYRVEVPQHNETSQ